MSKKAKLEAKLLNKTIDANELRTLLGKHGWTLDRQEGSHEAWVSGSSTFILATHGKDLKPYQMKQAIQALGLK